MRVLYITAAHCPYRDEFFEQLGEKCDLTVVFGSGENPERDSSWYKGVSSDNYNEIYLSARENRLFSRALLHICADGWDSIVIGCYNEPNQILAAFYMHCRHIPYIVNLDGPLFSSKGIKKLIRQRILKNASSCLVAGYCSPSSVINEVCRDAYVVPYPFTSLTLAQLKERAVCNAARETNRVLIVARYLEYKGIDVAIGSLSEIDVPLHIRIVGVGMHAEEVRRVLDERGLFDAEVIPFLSPELLAHEYQKATLMVLPSRQECWGLVVNEAAACGCPIVSTWGSGAAVEFLSRDYPQFLANPGDAETLRAAIETFLALDDCGKSEYSKFLISKSRSYSIESEVDAHMQLFEADFEQS